MATMVKLKLLQSLPEKAIEECRRLSREILFIIVWQPYHNNKINNAYTSFVL